jgi:hypothetical protein
MYLLIPGRHHLLTTFQFKYLFKILNAQTTAIAADGSMELFNEPIEGLVFAVTSANHSGTKRNPVPFHLRAMMIEDFCRNLNIKTWVFGIDDVGVLPDFASYTLQSIAHQSDFTLQLTPQNTALVCSTHVMEMYQKKGFKVLPAELATIDPQTFHALLPWEYVEKIAATSDWRADTEIIEGMHSASYKLWSIYGLGEKVKAVLNDPIIGDDGDITESRDYGTYVKQMDEIAHLKYQETAAYLKPGKIGDIGCAVGSWIKLAAQDQRLNESEFYGIEVTRKLYDICSQRKHNGEFANPSVFFAMKNAVTNLVFQANSMDTIHTSSLTHEIESYGNRGDLLDFIANRYNELKLGGVWVNRDVVGPENGNKEVFMMLNDADGRNADPFKEFDTEAELNTYLSQLSTFSKFLRFAKDFRAKENEVLQFSKVHINGLIGIKLKYKDAAEFMLTKDYTDNWNSEMHETFCFWSFDEWKQALERVGFRLRPESKAYQNPWIAENRWYGKVELFEDEELKNKMPYPPTNMLVVAEKIV